MPLTSSPRFAPHTPRREPAPGPDLPPLPPAERQPDEPVGGGGGGRGAGARLRALRSTLRAGRGGAVCARDPVSGPGCHAAPPLRPVSAPPGRAGAPGSRSHRPAPSPCLGLSFPIFKMGVTKVLGGVGLSKMTPVKRCTRPSTGSYDPGSVGEAPGQGRRRQKRLPLYLRSLPPAPATSKATSSRISRASTRRQ